MPRRVVHPLRAPERERWLGQAVRLLAPLLLPYTLPPVKVKTDFDMKGPDGAAASGLCWDDSPYCRIDIDRELSDELTILAVLLHELCHAAADPAVGHNGRYRIVWKLAGFQGLPTGYEASPALLGKLEAIAVKLGPYPAA